MSVLILRFCYKCCFNLKFFHRPSSWLDSGFRKCISIGFLLCAVIAIACCSLNFYLAKEHSKLRFIWFAFFFKTGLKYKNFVVIPVLEETYLDKFNSGRIQRGISLESNVRANDFHPNEEMMINGTVVDGVLVDG